ncbi:amidohydrolase [Myroides marinus]|uniref:Cytosine/adenosine deaminase n=1 Tax=Myroides marinus TaxID=703342 RepID=A0A1H6V1B2_9FLAO|nr:amidohydrolase [Myroides marinus]MDM1353686.1 amidohydrolase family protein [Myroides marinus]MDM1379423.1 amidohydrolase family protein [Myroides marinus]MDM1386635.1 amidohydrolase family protein [Myroides marinus]MDM1393848.1 amidohydrolase family protein [Myroides marinus]SEI98291.1 Cytosine/adenosine deaminase [Myroides marinus]
MINRKQFLGMTAAAAGGLFLPSISSEAKASNTRTYGKINELVLTNVLLETGFDYNAQGQVWRTKTELFEIYIANGVIVSIEKSGNTKAENVLRVDMRGMLMLPGFRDMHIHIDKTFYGERWYGDPKPGRSVKDMIDLERRILPDLLVRSVEKAEMAIDLMNSQGTYFARCQTNIDPTSGLKSLENLKIALENKKDVMGSEIVAFPQHGILYSDSEGLLREAAQMGIDYIGGLDPTTVDANMEKSLDVMIQIALDYNKGIDIHLHEGAKTGIPAIKHILKHVEANKALQGRTFISHGFALGQIEPKELDELSEQMSANGVGVISTVPLGRSMMPIPTFYKHNVSVMTGTDSIIDHWQPFGSCDMLEKAKHCAELYGWTDEFRLSRALQIATKDQVLPLNEKGERQWPKVGESADFVFVKASCSAEAVARTPDREATFYKGKKVYSRGNV